MATTTITALTLVNALDIDDTTVFAVDDNDAATRKMTLAQLRTALGSLSFTGNVTGTGPFGSIALTIAAGVVTFAQMATIATDRLIGRSTAGTGAPEAISIGSGLTLVAGVLSASAPATSAPSTTLLTHRTFGGF